MMQQLDLQGAFQISVILFMILAISKKHLYYYYHYYFHYFFKSINVLNLSVVLLWTKQ